MGNPIKTVIAGICVVVCLYFTVAMLWAELGMPTDQNFPHTIKLAQAESVMAPLVDHYNGQFKEMAESHLKSKDAEGPFGDYAYAMAIAVAFFAGAIAIMAIGSEDETEKTVVPAKK